MKLAYLRIYDNALAQLQGKGGNVDPVWAQTNVSFLFNITRILWFFWVLGRKLFDIPKDVVFVIILVFSNIFGFPVVNWALKRTKTVNFGCLPFILKFRISKDSFNSVFLIGDYLWSKFQQGWTMFGGVRTQPKTLKRLTSQPQMLYWWNLPQIYILLRSFIWQNLKGTTHKAQEAIN